MRFMLPFAAIALALVSHNLHAACAKLKSVKGADCAHLKVNLDVGACHLTHPKKQTQIECSKNGQTATVRVLTPDRVFFAKLNSQPGAWGRSAEWILAGEIEEQPTGREPKSTEGEATPATQVAAVTPPLAAPQGSEPAAAPAPADGTPIKEFVESTTISALLDFYYTYNFNRPKQPVPTSTTSGVGLPPNSNNLRYYNLYHNQLSLNLAEISIKHVGEETSLLIDLDFGQAADINAISPYSQVGYAASDEVSKHIGQAVLTYSPKNTRWTIAAGKMPTHMGLEGLKNKDNWQYTRSVLFGYGLPFWHVGMAFGYAAVPEKLQTTFFVYNGWNTIYDNNNGKTLGGQIKWTPNSDVMMSYNVIHGPENAEDEVNKKILHDVNAIFALTSKLQFAFDVAHGISQGQVTNSNASPQTVSWTAGTFAFKYTVNPKYFISPRFEFFNDSHGHILGGTKERLLGYTLTQGYNLTRDLQVRFELNYDRSDSNTRYTTFNGTSREQKSIDVGLLYSF